MIPSFSLWLFAVSLAASALGGTLGMASGIFIVPLLTVFGHIGIHTAIGASIVSVIACSCGGAAPFLKNGLTDRLWNLCIDCGRSSGRRWSGLRLAAADGGFPTGKEPRVAPWVLRILERVSERFPVGGIGKSESGEVRRKR